MAQNGWLAFLTEKLAGENVPRRRDVGAQPERRYRALNRRESSAKGRGGNGESHRSTRGRRNGAETVVDEGPRRRGEVIVERGDARLGEARKSVKWVHGG